MKKIVFALAGGLLAAASLSAVADDATPFRLDLPIVELNNPCTAAPDSIDGSLELRGTVQHADGVTFLQVQGKGKGVDAWGTAYNLGGNARFQFHDLLPAQVFLRLRMVSAGSGDNAFAVLALHVNEQGNVTRAEFSGVECRG